MAPLAAPPWTGVFAEISLRALLRLHHDYLLWSIKQTSEGGNPTALNRGPGVALADELTVCGAISQEFLASRFSTGTYVEGKDSLNIKAGRRHYRLTREVPYEDGKRRSDFCLERVVGEDEPKIERPRALIEAKRAFLWTTKLDGDVERVQKQTEDIRTDIAKLRDHELRFETLTEAPRGYVLVWNVTDTSHRTDVAPIDYANALKDEGNNFTIWQIKAAPLYVKLPLDTALRDWMVESWLWLILAEVTQQEDGSLRNEDRV